MAYTRKPDYPKPPPPLDPKRRELCGVGAMALLLSACGGSDYSSMTPAPAPAAPAPAPPPPAPAPTPTPTPPPTPAPPVGPSSCGATNISANHGHVLTIPVADLDSMVNKAYNIQGAGDHNHTVVLTPAQLQSIKALTAVQVNSSTEMAHFHEVTVNCV